MLTKPVVGPQPADTGCDLLNRAWIKEQSRIPNLFRHRIDSRRRNGASKGKCFQGRNVGRTKQSRQDKSARPAIEFTNVTVGDIPRKENIPLKSKCLHQAYHFRIVLSL